MSIVYCVFKKEKLKCAIAEWGMLLRDSKFKGTSTFEDVIQGARQYKGEDEEGYRSEFIRLVKLSEYLPKYSVK